MDVTLSSSLLGENHGTAFTRSGVGCIKKRGYCSFFFVDLDFVRTIQVVVADIFVCAEILMITT